MIHMIREVLADSFIVFSFFLMFLIAIGPGKLQNAIFDFLYSKFPKTMKRLENH